MPLSILSHQRAAAEGRAQGSRQSRARWMSERVQVCTEWRMVYSLRKQEHPFEWRSKTFLCMPTEWV